MPTLRGQEVWSYYGKRPIYPNPVFFFSSANDADLPSEIWDECFGLAGAPIGVDYAIKPLSMFVSPTKPDIPVWACDLVCDQTGKSCEEIFPDEGALSLHV